VHNGVYRFSFLLSFLFLLSDLFRTCDTQHADARHGETHTTDDGRRSSVHNGVYRFSFLLLFFIFFVFLSKLFRMRDTRHDDMTTHT